MIRSEIDQLIERLPKTKDGFPILIGDSVFIANDDKFYFGDDDILVFKVDSIMLKPTKGAMAQWYSGKFVIGGEDHETGNLDCYALKENMPI